MNNVVYPVKHRYLSLIETKMALIHEYYNGSTQSSMALHINKHLVHNDVIKVADALSRKYTILRCTLQRDSQGLYFVELHNTSDVKTECVSLSGAELSNKLCIDEVHKALNIRESLWRVALYNFDDYDHCQVVFTIHHSVIDAHGVNSLINDFCSFLELVLDGRPLIVNENEGVPDSIDDYLLPPKNSNIHSSSAKDFKRIPYEKPVPLENRLTQLKSFSLTTLQTDSLEKICIQENIKLNSYLAALLINHVFLLNIVEDIPLYFGTAVSLRGLVNNKGQQQNTLGCYVSVADSYFNSLDSNIYDLSVSYETQLYNSILRNCYIKRSFVTEDLEALIKSSDEDSFQGIGLTNFGSIDILEYKNFDVINFDEINNRVIGAAAVVLHIYKFNGRLNCSFVYVKPLITDEKIVDLCDGYKNSILDFIVHPESLHNK